MSKPDNVLNKFRSYSYHHVLIAANSTNTYDVFETNKFDLVNLLQPKETTVRSVFSQQSGRSKNEIVKYDLEDKTGSYVVVLNSTRDVDFYLDDITWENILLPRSGNISAQMAASEGSFVIYEPNGARFFTYLDDILNVLGSEAIGLTFYLKTFFIGYPDGSDGSSNPDVPQMIANIKPLAFNITDIQSEITNTGSKYTVSFVGSVNGVASLPMLDRVPQGCNTILCTTSPSNTEIPRASSTSLDQAFTRFQKFMNDKSDLGFQIQLNNAIVAGVPTDKIKSRTVRYEFHLDDHWKDYKYRIDNFNQLQAESSLNKGGSITLSPDARVSDALSLFMNHCSLYLKEEGEGEIDEVTGQTVKYTHRIETAQRGYCFSEPRGDKWGEFVLQYFIKRVKIIEATPKAIAQSTVVPDNVKQKAIEFDYMFTGQNVDIINLDMKFDGLFMLYSIGPRQVITKPLSQEQLSQMKGEQTVPVVPLAPTFQYRPYTPVGPVISGSDNFMLNHKPFPGEYASARALMNTLSTLSALQTNITIRGNPLFLNETIRTAKDLEKTKQQLDSEKTDSILGNTVHSPAYAKVNIRMINDEADGDLYSTPFWYQDYYIIVSVKNNFSRGTFTQELELITLIQDSGLKKVLGAEGSSKTTPATVDQTKSQPVNPKDTTPTVMDEISKKHPDKDINEQFFDFSK